MTTSTRTDQNTEIARHVAHHFALGPITYDLRENDLTMREGEFTPAATAAELLDALKRAQGIADTLPAGTPLVIPSYPIVIDDEGRELFVDIDRLTDTREQTNAVFVLLAEAVALQKASRDALIRAVGLHAHYGLDNND